MRSLITVVVAGSLACAGAVVPSGVRADRVHLDSGAVIEGKASRVGEKVVVELDSGRLTLSAGSVQRIEPGETDLQRVEARLRTLDPNDIEGLLALANYCRDRGMRSREQELLQRVLELSPDQPDARARLGYVRTESGWMTREEQYRAQGLIKRDGRWLTPEQWLAMQRLEAETRVAQLRRDQAEVELETRRAELAGQKADQAFDARRREQDAQAQAGAQSQDGMAAYYGPYGYAGYAGAPFLFPLPFRGDRGRDLRKPNPLPPPGPGGPAPSPIPGFRDPSNMSFQVPGYQDPRNYF